jgi:hypothetical protein
VKTQKCEKQYKGGNIVNSICFYPKNTKLQNGECIINKCKNGRMQIVNV